MSEPLKNLYSIELLESVSAQLQHHYPSFDRLGFIAYVMDDEWQHRELKQRMTHIAAALHHFLPMPYSKALTLLMAISIRFTGFEYMFFPDFVERYGLGHYQDSIIALEHFTEYASSEYAVRPFIKHYPDQMMAQMMIWAKSDNHHLRRLASEGCRPRLPWAMALADFKQHPAAILPILEQLKNDDSEYVRRSVANNLNDISKDNPAIVIDIAQHWFGEHPQTNWLVKHACRTLLKQGQPEIMQLFGLVKPEHIAISHFSVQPSVKMGGKVTFSFMLVSELALGRVRIEYALGFVKKNKQLFKKVFKISEADIKTHTKTVTKSHSFKKISTRTYYEGNHSLSIIVNGHEIAHKMFVLSADVTQ